MGNVGKLRDMAADARRLGYMVSEAVFYNGAISLGVPIYDKHGDVVAAITASAIPERMEPERCGEIARIIKKIAAEYA